MAATTAAHFIRLDNRGLIALAGDGTIAFLQNLVTNDMEPLAAGRAVYAALLAPQGRYLFDFLLAPLGGRILLDCERARLDELKRRLTLYRLRAKVAIDDVSENYAVFALAGAEAARCASLSDASGARSLGDGIAYADPRLAALGGRAVLPRGVGEAPLIAAGLRAAPREIYDRLRYRLGVGEGAAELGANGTLALETGLEALNGVSFAKGCYVGQEVTTRMKTRSLVKKRLVPVAIDGPPPAPGTAVRRGSIEAGEMRAASGDIGLALMRLDALHGDGPLTAGAATLTPQPAAWLGLP